MTVCIAIQVNDCVVFAADSASSMVGIDSGGQPAVVNVYNHGKKVFCLHKGIPVMGMTAGMGNIGGSSIEVLAKDLRANLTNGPNAVDPANFTVEPIGKAAFAYFKDQYEKDANKPTGPHAFEFFVSGISSGARFGEIWKISIVNGVIDGPTLQLPNGDCGILWAGQPEAMNRLIFGYAGALPGVLQAAGIGEPQLSLLLNSIRSQTQAQLHHPAMPVQDAIDLAIYLVDTTIGFTKFLPGANTVGGAIDVATVTRHEGFKWIRRKHYYPGNLNPLETDHVGGRKA